MRPRNGMWLLAWVVGCTGLEVATPFGFIDEPTLAYVVARPRTVDKKAAQEVHSGLRLYRHYYFLSGVSEPAHFFQANWHTVTGPLVRTCAVVEGEDGAIRVDFLRGMAGGLAVPLPHAPRVIPSEVKRYADAIVTKIEAQEGKAQDIELQYRGLHREVALHEVIPLSVAKDGCRGAARGRFILAVPLALGTLDLRDAPLQVTGWMHGVGRSCADDMLAATWLQFRTETRGGAVKLPALLEDGSDERRALIRAVADGIQIMLAGKQGPDPRALYTDSRTLPAMSQDLSVRVLMKHPEVTRTVTVPAAQAVLHGVSTTSELRFLGVPIVLRLSVDSDFDPETSKPDEHGWSAFNINLAWDLTDGQGRSRSQRTTLKATGIIDGDRVALFQLQKVPMTQPLPSRNPTVLEQLQVTIGHL